MTHDVAISLCCGFPERARRDSLGHQRLTGNLSRIHTSNNVESTLSNATSRNDSFDEVECCFGNNVERNFVLSTKSKQIEHVQFASTLSKGRNFTKKNLFDIVAVFDNNIVSCFDIVAGVDGALVVTRQQNGHAQFLQQSQAIRLPT